MDSHAFSDDEKSKIREAIRGKYISVSSSAAGMFKYLTGKDGAVALGYDKEILKEMPEDVLSSFCGVGNPFALDDIVPGSSVLDIGCGGGFDLLVARKKTGSTARVCGVDLTLEMIERARSNFSRLGVDDIETVHITSENLPFADASFDIIISNGVINLSPAKAELFAEMYRVLKPGGRVQFADIVLDKELPPHMAGNLDAWSQ